MYDCEYLRLFLTEKERGYYKGVVTVLYHYKDV